MSTINFSTSADFNLQDNVLDVYLPVLPNTKDLVQELMDLKSPKIEHYDEATLVAVEWSFHGKAVNKVLGNKKWQKMFK